MLQTMSENRLVWLWMIMAIFLHSLEEQDPTKMPDIYQLPLKLWLCQKYNNGGMIWRIERERERKEIWGEREREGGVE